MRGNTSDKTTLADMLKKVTQRYGKERRAWIMDRGIPTEDTLEEMHRSEPAVRYLVGTPKGRLTKLEKDLAGKDWQKRENITRDELLMAIGAAKEKAGRNAHRLVKLHLPTASQKASATTFRFELEREKLRTTLRHEGQYLLRGNLVGEDPAELWRNYINLVRIEESFRTLKGDLGLRPVIHQLDNRIEAHVFISFLAYCLHVTLEKYNKKAATGLSSRSVLERMIEIQMLDVSIPATDGREVRMRRYTKPENVHELLLDKLGFTLPGQPPPEIRMPGLVVETF